MKTFKTKLESYGAFSTEINPKFQHIIDSIPTQLTPPMKLQLLVHYLTLLMSQFRIPISYNGQLIPINSISFLFSYSGSGKDTTINILKNMIEPSLNLIEEQQQNFNIKRAEDIWQRSGKGEIEDYLLNIPPMEIGISTPEGLIQSLENLSKVPLGAININTNEFISEVMNSSLNLFSMLNILAELYDIGQKNSKQLKDKDKENKPLKNIFINGLFTSSFNLTTDSSIRKRITQEFQSKFARRSSITYNQNVNNLEEISDVDEWVQKQITLRYKNQDTLHHIADYLSNTIVQDLLESTPKFITLSPEALTILVLYQEYCKRYSKCYERIEYSFSYLNILNRYWQALKLSGTLCLLDQKREIEPKHLIDAINIIEIINADIFKFEKDLSKMPYEILVDYCQNLYMENYLKVKIPIHLLKKINIIKDIKNLDELLILCNSEDREGIYSYNKQDKNLEYYRMEKLDTYTISCAKVNSSDKKQMVHNLYQKLMPYEVPLPKLADMLKTSLIYSSYHFKHNIRNKENLIPITNLLVLDVDNCDYTIDEFHSIIKGSLNHLIATTSDKNNLNKFRILIPLEYKTTINSEDYNRLIRIIVRDYLLGIQIDSLPQSQAFFAYQGSKVLYQFESEFLNIKDYLVEINNNLPYKDLREYPDKEKKNMLSNKFITFKFAFDSTTGNRHKNMILAINRAYDLGATYEEALQLLEEINDFIDYPLELTEFQKTILPHLRKKYARN